jgi:hypothetical protein
MISVTQAHFGPYDVTQAHSGPYDVTQAHSRPYDVTQAHSGPYFVGTAILTDECQCNHGQSHGPRSRSR